MKTILDKIKDYKLQELESKKRKVSPQDIKLKSNDSPDCLNFVKNFKDQEINIIAEVKKASPSKGIIRENFNPLEIAQIYEEHGAKSLSVLTDQHFFQGHLDYLYKIKQKVKIPCLRKDFTIDEYHIFEAKAHHADAILLIVAILDDHQLKDYHDLAQELGLSILVEIHNEEELNRALKIEPKILGVNNRNLHTFETKLETSYHLIEKMKSVPFCISESGLNHHDDLVKLNEAGFNGFLIGETLMKEKDIGRKLSQLIKGT